MDNTFVKVEGVENPPACEKTVPSARKAMKPSSKGSTEIAFVRPVTTEAPLAVTRTTVPSFFSRALLKLPAAMATRFD